MTATFLPEPEPRVRDYTIVSVDDHLIEPAHCFEGRLPAALQDRRQDLGVDQLLVGQGPGDEVRGPLDEIHDRCIRRLTAAMLVIVAFRRRTLLPLDDIFGCLKDRIPKLTRSSLHRCLERHDISRLPESEEKASKRGRFADTTIGYVHIDICELRLAEGKLNMFLAIDRVSKFTYVEFHENAGKMNGADFLRNVVKAFPYKIHTVLTDNGMAFADLPKNRNGATRRYLGAHIFDRVCTENGIEHRLTKPYHPWTNGQAERMNRTIKEATIKVFHYPSLESLKAHVLAFVTAYNFAKHLKALRWKTPFEAICAAWTKDPEAFIINPRHLIPGPNS